MPPLVGVAVNVIGVPEGTVVPPFAEILTEGVIDVLTVTVNSFEVAVVGLAQAALEVITHVIFALFAGLL